MGRLSQTLSALQQALAVLRTLLTVGVLGLLLVGGYWTYHLWHEKTQYQQYLQHLLGEQRVAELCVLTQERLPDHVPRTTLRFQEFRGDGEALTPVSITLPGEEIYVDALVTVFETDAVQRGEAHSLYLFRRIFSERVAPRDGVSLYRDTSTHDGIPQPYVDHTIDRRIQHHVWAHLWRLIEDSAYAEAHRVRTQFGQAVYARMEPGQCYTLTLQNHGGLLLQAGSGRHQKS